MKVRHALGYIQVASLRFSNPGARQNETKPKKINKSPTRGLMLLGENLKAPPNASIAFDRSNTKWTDKLLNSKKR